MDEARRATLEYIMWFLKTSHTFNAIPLCGLKLTGKIIFPKFSPLKNVPFAKGMSKMSHWNKAVSVAHAMGPDGLCASSPPFFHPLLPPPPHSLEFYQARVGAAFYTKVKTTKKKIATMLTRNKSSIEKQSSPLTQPHLLSPPRVSSFLMGQYKQLLVGGGGGGRLLSLGKSSAANFGSHTIVWLVESKRTQGGWRDFSVKETIAEHSWCPPSLFPSSLHRHFERERECFWEHASGPTGIGNKSRKLCSPVDSVSARITKLQTDKTQERSQGGGGQGEDRREQ